MDKQPIFQSTTGDGQDTVDDRTAAHHRDHQRQVCTSLDSAFPASDEFSLATSVDAIYGLARELQTQSHRARSDTVYTQPSIRRTDDVVVHVQI